MFNRIVIRKNAIFTNPGTPEDSIWFASVTSSDQTSYCHLRSPKVPDITEPVWMPIRISTSTPVASRIKLKKAFLEIII